MNDTERIQWVEKDEGLHNWWRASGQSLRHFVRDNREDIDAAIEPVTTGAKPPHWLAYGPGGAA